MQVRPRFKNRLIRYETNDEFATVTQRIDIDQRNYSWSIPEESYSIVHERSRIIEQERWSWCVNKSWTINYEMMKTITCLSNTPWRDSLPEQ